jgi:hypothetical protein
LITGCTTKPRLARFYASVTGLPDLVIWPGTKNEREYAVFRLADRRQPIGPLGPCDK